ncbi:MAG: C39 family peptidase [Chloroflexi bacterium]|nr:C39 family peptidase [Chloroflexota bacterium]
MQTIFTPGRLRTAPRRSRLRRPASLLVTLCAMLMPSLASLAPGFSPAAFAAPLYDVAAASSTPVRPYSYAAISSSTTYDIMVADGVNKDRRAARIKVDSVFFGDVSSRLSADGSNAAFRVTGDRLGGSSIYAVNVDSGKYSLIASSKSAAESIGSYAWSPAGNTLAYVRYAPALDPANVDDGYGTIYLFSVGYQAARLSGSLGSDRLLAFAGDGRGVYVSRREDAPGGALEHLVYLPISGGEGTVLMRSTPGLRYSKFAVWSPPNAPAKVACLAEGNFALAAAAPGAAPAVTAATAVSGTTSLTTTQTTAQPKVSLVSTAGTLTRPNGMGLVISDPAGTMPVLVRRDAEDFTRLVWAPDGENLVMGGTRSGAAWDVDVNGNRHAVDTSLLGLNSISASTNGSLMLLADNPVSRITTLDYSSGNVVSSRSVGITPKAGAAAVRLPVPYIQQVNDIAQAGDGNWACGPTSVAMTLAYYGKIEPWGEYLAQQVTASASPGAAPDPPQSVKAISGSDYAPYVTNSYTNNGRTYSASAPDPRGNMLAGLYGTISPNGLADWQTMVSVLQWHGLSSNYVGATWDGVVGALKRGHPVILGNQLTSQGHILVVIGYTTDGNLIVNDPYGNRFIPGYGSNNGNGVVYPWKRVTARRGLEVIGTYPPPTHTPTNTPVPTITPPTGTPTSLPATTTPTNIPATAMPADVPATAYVPTNTQATPEVTVPVDILTPEITPTSSPEYTPTPPETLPPTVELPTLIPQPSPTPKVDGSNDLYHNQA